MQLIQPRTNRAKFACIPSQMKFSLKILLVDPFLCVQFFRSVTLLASVP